MAGNKTVQNQGDVSAFLSQIQNEEKRNDCLQLLNLMQGITNQEPAMWGGSIVGFGSYHYRYESGREGDFLRVGFSPRAQNISIYIMPGLGNFEEQLSTLGKHKIGKSCLYVKRLSDVDFDVLTDIIKQSVEIMADRYPD
ncbi:DUF1801 domain-containing protein [Alteromonadaceae bacterium M269]|nr:DUF1801 domain-containing protein [Alteromonadaceae bacterium M269]